MESEPFRVSVYWDTDEECKYVSNVLESVSPGHTYVYRGITDGWVTDEKLQELRRQGLTVILTGVTPPHPSTDTAAQIAASSVETSSPRESNDGGDNGQAPD